MITAGRRPALHARGAGGDDSRESPQTRQAGNVGLGRRLKRTANARSLGRRTASAFPRRGGGRLQRSSLPAAGRHSMRPVPHETIRATGRRPHPAHGASVRDRRGTRTATARSPGRRTASAFLSAGQGRRSQAGARYGCSVHRCRPRAGTPCAQSRTRRFARPAVDRTPRMERRSATDAGRGRRPPASSRRPAPASDLAHRVPGPRETPFRLQKVLDWHNQTPE
jgi:hypothetical protein